MGEQFEGTTGGKTWLAAIVCGPAAGTLMGLAMGATGLLISLAGGGDGYSPASYVYMGCLLGAVFGWPIMLFFGLPAHAWLHRRGSRKVGHYLLAGVPVGLVAIFIFVLWSGAVGALGSTNAFLATLAPSIFLGLMLAVLASWIFWLIRRPDKDVSRLGRIAAASK